MKKNVKGFIGLFTGIAALLLICIALFVPTYKVNGTSLSLHGTLNVTFALIGAGLGIIAIIFGILSRKGRGTQKGPRKAGVIIGIFAIVIGLIASALCSLSRTIADYANGKQDPAFSQMDDASRKTFDDALNQLKEAFPEK